MYRPPNNYCFIDGCNLHLTYEHLDWKLDYRKLRVYLKKRHQVQVAYYFVGYVLKNSDIYRKLEEYGYELKHEPTTRRADGGTVGNLDDYIIKEVKWNINKYDRAILISGDHHFASLVKELNDQNKSDAISKLKGIIDKNNKLLNENQIIVIEDLNVKGILKNHNLAKSIQELSLSRFKNILEYKADWLNKDVIIIDRWFPSSKLCSVCGYKKDDLTLQDRSWTCPECNTHHDRDINAAINIKNEGYKIKIGLSSPELTHQESKTLVPL
jgi:IS605 OrfB family transposase